MEYENIQLSKFISLILRHKPEVINIKLDENGWVNIEEFIYKINEHGHYNVNFEILKNIVNSNDKKRFKISEDNLKIRASQGHSIDVELNLKEKEPPQTLYHGTATRFIDSIKEKGLVKMNRQHVHLSLNEETAKNVGKRHGKPEILLIDSGAMNRDGFKFYLSDNNVWLTEFIPTIYIAFD